MMALAAIVQAALEKTAMPGRQKVVAIVLAVAMLLAVIELVRRRKLREEYSVLWILTAIALLILAFNYRILVFFTDLIGAVHATSALLFGGILFVMLLGLQFSVRMSRLTYRMKVLSRRLALLEEEVRGEDARRDPGNDAD
jgi:hypothetical protein